MNLNPGIELDIAWGMDDARVRIDAAERVGRVRSWMQDKQLDGVLLSRRDNFAWLTVGGDNHVLKTTETGAGHLLITPDKQYLVAYTMDGERILSEEVPGQGYELVSVRWYEDEPRLKALSLGGARIAADTDLPGALDSSVELSRMHAPLSALELRRYRWLAATTGVTLEEVARRIRPRMSERQVAQEITCLFVSQGIDVDVLLVGSDERVEHIRHVVPSPKSIERYVLFNPTARRWGLHANVSRCVSFGPPKESLKRAFHAVLQMQARILGMLAPGVPYAQILELQKSWYAEFGYPEEWRSHFQGGTTGYVISDAGLGLTGERIADGQAFDWFVTLPGVMVEELALLADGHLELASAGVDWPMAAVPTGQGEIYLPDMWVA
ncbi:MAG TPA: M24 family metallopeptidase [Anaerolineaceae bacterium]|jgi:antitoxin VapB